MAGKKVWLCAGIGEPQGFIKKMEKTGVSVLGVTLFKDHHFYAEEEVRKIPLGEADFLVITEKDSVRFPPVKLPKPVVYPKIELVVEGLNLGVVKGMEKDMARAVLKILPAGHATVIEAPEAFNEAVLEFMTSL